MIPLDEGDPSFDGSSSLHLSIDLRLAFIKKFPTVVGSNPNCRAIVTCISFDGRFVSWKMNKKYEAINPKREREQEN